MFVPQSVLHTVPSFTWKRSRHNLIFGSLVQIGFVKGNRKKIHVNLCIDFGGQGLMGTVHYSFALFWNYVYEGVQLIPSFLSIHVLLTH